MSFLLFIAGLAIALLAHFPVKWFYDRARSESGFPDLDETETIKPRVPQWFIGTFERLLAFVLVAFGADATQIVTILIAWMLAKIAANWQRRPGTDPEVRASTLIALMAGTLSLLLGVLGGFVAR
jgi:hypothetical protein